MNSRVEIIGILDIIPDMIAWNNLYNILKITKNILNLHSAHIMVVHLITSYYLNI